MEYLFCYKNTTLEFDEGEAIVSSLKIAVTGASGYVGRALVPMLMERLCNVLVVGRDIEKLKLIFPDLECQSTEQFLNSRESFDLVLHLAVLNNDAQASFTEFTATNVELTRSIAMKARSNSSKFFVLASSIHALNDLKHGHYAESKRMAKHAVNEAMGTGACILYLPLVYTGRGASHTGIFEEVAKLDVKTVVRRSYIFEASRTRIKYCRNFSWFNSPKWRGDYFVKNETANNKFYRFFSRTLDLTFCVLIIVCFFWLIAAIAVIVKLDSNGPAIFKQIRVGRHQMPFSIYKFRTMKVDAPNVATHLSSKQQLTQVGRIIRKLKFDELPQVFNILRGEISLIGPRPCLPSQKELILEREKRGVFEATPGITGLAQCAGIDMSRQLSWRGQMHHI